MARRMELWFGCCAVAAALVASTATAEPYALASPGANDENTVSPIKHVIVIIGESRGFDHVFGGYVAKPGQTVLNILSEGVIAANGKPGPNFGRQTIFGQPTQFGAAVTHRFEIAPTTAKAPYSRLPPPGAAGAPTNQDDLNPPPFATVEAAANYEHGLFPGDIALVTTGASGLSGTHVPDSRIENVLSLPNGPFQLTGAAMPYDAYTGSPVHRFFQMWQQLDCDVSHASAANPSGCLADLFPWVETTVGAGSNGKPPPAGYDPATYQAPEGAAAMGFYNMAQGDSPYFRKLADEYAISDNFHQAVAGGAGANHIMLGYADMIFFSDTNGKPAVPPSGQIENPNPQPRSNNFWINDGYGSVATKIGGSFANCSDRKQPGVAPIIAYLNAMRVKANCQSTAFYMVNNYNPAYVGDGALDSAATGPFTIPPTHVRHLGDSLNAGRVSWSYFGEGWNDYRADPDRVRNPAGYLYCGICNPFQYSAATMTDRQQRETRLHDTMDLYRAIAAGALPAVSIVTPNALNDGHPASSKLDLFESFTRRIITELRNNPALWKDTAVFVTFSDGGGYWDSGYVQPVDFFGDGTRVPLIVVSPYSTGGRVVHSYGDLVSIDKFIERNWKLGPISARSRDNLKNPVSTSSNPYVPTNRPAIGDLFDMFAF